MSTEDKTSNEMKEHLFEGEHFLITGGGSGIGKAIAEEAKQLGAIVTVVDIARGENIVVGDITDRESLEKIAKNLSASYGKVDYLILSAGVMQKQSGDVEEEEWERVHNINARGTENSFTVFQDLLTDNATVVFLSSDLINHPNPSVPAYASSKKAIAEFAAEQAKMHPNLRVLTLLPGPVDTPLFRYGKSEDILKRISESVGILSPREFAEILLLDLLPNTDKYSSGSQIIIYKNKVEKMASQ